MCKYSHEYIHYDECSHCATPSVLCLFLMSVFVIMNISNPRHRMYYDDYSMNVFNIVTVLMVQLGTSCVFDSPGLARNEPTPGKHLHGDSTP